MSTPIHHRWVFRLLLALFCGGMGMTRLEAGCGDYLDFRQTSHTTVNHPLDRLPGGARCQGPQCSKPVPLHPVQDPLSDFKWLGGKGVLIGLAHSETEGQTPVFPLVDAKPFLPSGHPQGMIKPPRA